ncbi:MAG: inositol monophosphatase family protein [Burkholderiales bacterium]|nr:inositol monophosphatase family protein [Burkholderiales bacterium]
MTAMHIGSPHDTRLLEQVTAAVRQVAAEQIMPRFLRVGHERKSDGSPFTQADLAAQTALVEALQRIHDVPVMGEEMTAERQAQLWLSGEEGMWCVDPIDGTSNFVNGVPYFAVSVALMRRGRSELAVVYNPMLDEAFTARRGVGAFMNGTPLPLRPVARELAHAIAGVDFKRLPPKLACTLAAQSPCSSQRSFGAGTLDWCYAAAGRFDVYLHGGQKLWDYAAGALIFEESGGSVCSLTGDDFWTEALWQRSVIAALDPQLFVQWRDWIRAHL